MSLSRITRIVLILAVTVMGIGVAVPAAAQGDNTLIMARAVDATGLDPHTQTAFASLRLLELIYEPLILADEPTANLDDVRRQALAQQIMNVKGFRQLFVISHDDTFEQATQNLVRVKRHGSSSIVDTPES